jgi:hypothetical protein
MIRCSERHDEWASDKQLPWAGGEAVRGVGDAYDRGVGNLPLLPGMVVLAQI